MELDFIEIGTSNFYTLIQECDEDAKGISIEPVAYYLNCLPNKKNVIKIQAAVTKTKTTDTVDIYYIPEHTIKERGFYDWFGGCNTINTYHPLHISYGLTDYVKIDKVPLITMKELYESYDIQTVKFIKIDTEGHDCDILSGLFDFLKTKDNTSIFPHKITFESNEWTPSEKVDNIINEAVELGYSVVTRGYDTTLIFNIPS